MQKLTILSLFLYGIIGFSNVLHDAIEEGNAEEVRALMGVFKPDTYAYEKLKKCPEDKRAEIKEILDNYCSQYNITFQSPIEANYSTDKNNRKYPGNKQTNSAIIDSNHILQIFPADETSMRRIGPTDIAFLINETWVLQQKFEKSCGYAVLLMRELDLGLEPSMKSYASNDNGTFKDQLESLFQEKGMDIESISGAGNQVYINNEKTNLFHYLNENIPLKGPAVMGIPQGHWIIIDHIEMPNEEKEIQGSAIIRDPYHGWKIQITWAGFVSLILKKGTSHNWQETSQKGLYDIIWTKKSSHNSNINKPFLTISFPPVPRLSIEDNEPTEEELERIRKILEGELIDF